MDSNSSTGATKRLVALVRMLHDDTGSGENGAKAYLALLEAKGTPKEAHGSALFCLQDGPAETALEGLHIEEPCVVKGADRLFSCPRFPDLETHDKTGESLNNVFRLRVDKGERTAAYTGRCRELFEKAAREGIELPDVARCVVHAWVWNARLLFWRLQDSRTRSETLHRRFVPLPDHLGCDQGVCSRHG